MKRLLMGQRVRITDRQHALHGRAGKVMRVRHSDEGAWIHMDTAIPERDRAFPAGDPRQDHVLLFPEQCARAEKGLQ